MAQRPGDRTLHRVKTVPPTPAKTPAQRLRSAVMLDAGGREIPVIVRYAATVLALALLTGVLWPLHQSIGSLSVGFLYLIVVIGATTFGGQGAGILASILGFTLFDFFLVPPYLTLAIKEPEDVFALFVFLGVSTLVSWLLAHAREQARQARQRAEDLSRLYELSQAIIGAQQPDEVLPKIADKVAQVFEVEACWIFLPDDGQQLAVRAQAPEGVRPPTRSELGMARWSFDHDSEVGQGAVMPPQFQQQASGTITAFAPLRAADRTIGVLAVAGKKSGFPFTATERTILATFAGQAAVALERLRLLREADRADMLDRADRLK